MVPPGPEVTLTEEERIESAKYLPRELPARLFEEERFVFPETYGLNRVRLLIKDPEWVFAHWDVDPAHLGAMRASLGSRVAALSPLTLRITDPANGGASVILLPNGARSWYVRTDSARRSYRAQLGVTLPSGEFRLLAESNTVTMPRVGPSPEKATRTFSYRKAAALSAQEAAAAIHEALPVAEPWQPQPVAGSGEGVAALATGPAIERGGASDAFRR